MSVLASPGVILSPTATKTPTPTNYLDGNDFDYTNPYLPDTEKIIVDRFGNQMITGLIEAMGNEKTFSSDDYKWTEDGRLTQLGSGVTRSGNVFTLNNHTVRVGNTIYARALDGSAERKGRVTAVTTNDFTVLCGNAAGWAAIGTADIVLYAFGTEFLKGTTGMDQSLNSQVSYFENTPVNIKEMVTESGSNLAQITWLYIDKGPKTGYVWYFKNYNDTEKRFRNAIESELILGERWAGDLLAAGYQGTQGLYSAVREGNIFGGLISDLDDVDSVIERFNAQGMLSENYMYNTTAQGAAISDFLKTEMVTSLGWGAFNNSEEMALKLDFSGFKRSGYNFYTSRCRFMDEPTTQGSNVGAVKVHGLIIPYGSTPIYDKTNSTSASVPFLHSMHRAYGDTNRKYEMSVRDFKTGTSGGADRLTVDFLTERMLVTASRNNFMIVQGS